jgi:hypothetical protein
MTNSSSNPRIHEHILVAGATLTCWPGRSRPVLVHSFWIRPPLKSGCLFLKRNPLLLPDLRGRFVAMAPKQPWRIIMVFAFQQSHTERSNAWMARFRRLARGYEQLAATLAGLHFVAFAILMLKRFVELMV